MTSNSEKKNILYFEGNLDGTIGGSFFSLLYLIEGLDKNLYRPTVAFYWHNSLVSEYEKAGAEVVIIEPPKPITISKKYVINIGILSKCVGILQKVINFMRFFVLQSIKFAWFIKKRRINLVHLNNSIIRNHSWMLASLLTNTACISHERGINRTYPRLAKIFAPGLDAIICISDAVKQGMQRCNIKNNNMYIIHNGIDPKKLEVDVSPENIKKKFSIPENSPIIGIVGNIKEWKGQEVVLKSMVILCSKFPSLRCFIVGGVSDADEYYYGRLNKIISSNELEKNIIFVGFQDNVANYVNAMDIVIHASIEPEPFGRVLIEAMALKKPVIASRGGGVDEIVANNTTGLCVTPGDEAELATAIDTILSKPGLGVKMGEEGWERVISKFHINQNVRQTMKLYASLLTSKAHGLTADNG